jgi:glyoxylase-like metal-dependent hydrolase (beta-lactamase superfamily II)
MKDIARRRFINSFVSAAALANLNPGSFKSSLAGKDMSAESRRAIRLKGRSDSRVSHWDVVTIGNLSRNRYWGESDERALHSVICSCTVISGKDFHIIVDPSLSDEAAMTAELKRRTGLTPDNINMVFITHKHGDHLAGLKHFPKSRWIAGTEVADELNSSGSLSGIIEPAGSRLFDSVDVIPTPGHTPAHYSLRFDFKGLSVVVAGDSVATKDFWDEKRMYYNVMDLAESEKTMEKIDSVADIIVPGHDNCFFNL